MTDSPIRTFGDVDRLYEALAMARAEFGVIAKRKTATVTAREGKRGYSYRYAELSDVNDAVVPALSKYGLVAIQPTVLAGGSMIVVTRLTHRSGAWIESDYPVAGIGGSIAHQVIGGALTYARRYALCAILNVSAEDDVDSGEDAEVTDQAPWPDQPKAAPARAEPPRRAPAPAQGNVRPTQSIGGEAASSTGATTPTTSEATKRPSVIDKNDPIIVDLKDHLGSWDALRLWYNANKEKIDARSEEWKNEFYARYDGHAERLKKEADLTAAAASASPY